MGICHQFAINIYIRNYTTSAAAADDDDNVNNTLTILIIYTAVNINIQTRVHDCLGICCSTSTYKHEYTTA